MLSEATPRRPRLFGGRSARPLRWWVLPAAALALGGAFALWPAQPARQGDVIAAEPRTLSIGDRAVAELSSGAHVRWSGDDAELEVQQHRGEVTYRVEPGASFRVQTPYGAVAVLGTVFRVVVADSDKAGGEPMKKAWGIAGASATLGALLFVSVDRGSVLLSNGEHQLALDAGQAGSIGADGVPRLEKPTPRAAVGAPVGSPPEEAERKRLRQVADAVRRHAARQRAARAASAATEKPGAPEQGPSEPAPPPMVFRPHPDAPPPDPAREEEPQRDYIRRTMREQYLPVARDCYSELLARKPTAGGRITLEFAIVGDADAGVVDRVALQEDQTTIDDEEFRLCMSESMYTAVFEPPPPGASETTVVYPIMLSPD